MGTSTLKKRIMTLVLALVLIFTGLPLSPIQSASASYPNDDYNWPASWLDVVYGGVWSREAILSHMDIYRLYGFNENFAWYSSEDVITVQPNDPRSWASRGPIYVYGRNRSWGPDRYGFWWTTLNWIFYSGARVRVWKYGDSFIAKACGNMTSFANNPAPPKISGYKWNDLNGNGQWDAGEPGLPGWEIRLYKDGIQCATAWTNSSGYYEFSIDATQGLIPGSYSLGEGLQSGWRQTRVPGSVEVFRGVPAYNYGGNNFGNALNQGAVSGYKWDDSNANGVWDSGEQPISNWPITIDNGSARQTVYTNSQGYYRATLNVGNYRIYEVLPNGSWQKTYPASDGYSRYVGGGDNISSLNFGNVKVGKIIPRKISDNDQSGTWSIGDELINGWAMHLDKGSSKDFCPLIATPGSWDRLLPGVDYSVWEESVPGWVPTDGQPRKQIVLGEGQEKTVDFFNVKTSNIVVSKFHDLNANHDRDADEPPIEGWEFRLTRADGTLVTADASGTPIVNPAKTDANGQITFGNLLPGTYYVNESMKDYWIPTTFTSKQVDVGPGETVSTPFGNVNVGNLSGIKFHDYNLNRHKDEGEPGVEGVVIRLDGNETTVTASDGTYSFKNVLPGQHTLSEEVPDGWKAKTPAQYTVEIAAGQENIAPDFGNVELGSISGFKFDDSNANGTWDTSSSSKPEQPLSSWKIRLSGTLANGASFETTTTTTQQNGAFRFSELEPGEYKVEEVMQDGWKQTVSPAVVHVDPGQDVASQNFGNIKLASIAGSKFDDSNGNGIYEPESEHKVPGWKGIVLKGTDVLGNPITQETTTDENGDFVFDGLLPGQYSVNENPSVQGAIVDPAKIGNYAEPGWFETTDTPNFSLEEGQALVNKNVANQWYGWIWGQVTDEYTKAPIAGATVTLAETGQTATTNASGYYFFPELLANGTAQYPSKDYIVELTVPSDYLTHDAVDKSATVVEKQGTAINFNVYQQIWSQGTAPRTIGYWKNWDNHYTYDQMKAFVDDAKSASGLFGTLTVENVSKYLTITKYSTMQDKAQAQLLASWLNVVSAKLGVDVTVNLGSVCGWNSVIKNANSDGSITVASLLREIDSYTQQVAAGSLQLSKDAWEVIKNVLDSLNNGLLF